jgi:hypothetical protein
MSAGGAVLGSDSHANILRLSGCEADPLPAPAPLTGCSNGDPQLTHSMTEAGIPLERTFIVFSLHVYPHFPVQVHCFSSAYVASITRFLILLVSHDHSRQIASHWPSLTKTTHCLSRMFF